MSRGLIGFLAFLAVIVVGLAVVAYLLGPNVLAFVFHSERRTEPVVIVNLLDFADTQQADSYREQFERPAAVLINALGGREIWRASARDVVRGDVLDGWSALQLVAYPSRSAFIELVTGSHYRALLGARRDGLKRGAILSATPAFDFDLQGTQAQAVRFLLGAHDDSIGTYDSKWRDEDEKVLGRHAGKLIWRARLNPLVAEPEQRFGTMLVYGFTDAAQRDDWAADAERETLQALQRRLFRRDVIVLADTQVDPDTRSAAPEEAATVTDTRSAAAPEETATVADPGSTAETPRNSP
jgi:uncharacterized protein (DUF1330 family)